MEAASKCQAAALTLFSVSDFAGSHTAFAAVGQRATGWQSAMFLP